MLLHGASGNLRDLATPLLGPLSRHARVIAVDRPGMGYSDPIGPEPWLLASQARALRAALAEIGVERAVLLGHSYSGALALDWVLEAPETVAGIVMLCGAAMDWGGALTGHYRLSTKPVIGGIFANAVPLTVGEAKLRRAVEEIFAPQPVPEGYLQAAGVDLAIRPATFRHNAQAIATLHRQIVANQTRYGEIRCPVTILHGSEDVIVPADVHAWPLAEVLPEARVRMLEGIGHMPHWVAPETVVEELAGMTAAAA